MPKTRQQLAARGRGSDEDVEDPVADAHNSRMALVSLEWCLAF